MFPGQGSQAVGMGASLFPLYPGLTRTASEILGFDLVDLCLRGSASDLARTEATQPAVYVVNALTWFESVHRHEATADVFLGHSLGELNALLCADVFDFETGLQIVQRRAALMADIAGGGMLAVLGPPLEEVQAALREPDVHVAAFNTARQTVVAGPAASLAQLRERLRREGIACSPLPVGGAFHTPHMASARAAFEAFLRSLPLRPLRAIVYANATAAPYTADAVVETLGRQFVEPVRWRQSVMEILRLDGGATFADTGGGALDRMARTIREENAGVPC